MQFSQYSKKYVYEKKNACMYSDEEYQILMLEINFTIVKLYNVIIVRDQITTTKQGVLVTNSSHLQRVLVVFRVTIVVVLSLNTIHVSVVCTTLQIFLSFTY